MSTRKLFTAGLLSFAVAIPAGTYAQTEYDTDGDGTVNEEELEAALTAEFEATDTDDDGLVSLSELQARLDRKETERFQTLDTDGNGSLNPTEFTSAKNDVGPRGPFGGERATTARANLFTLADTDKDGALSLAEFKAIGPGQNHLLHIFAHMDANGDGAISQDEFLLPPTKGLSRPRSRR
jgi:Ca2+-binding EF-hand superfamily protein